MNLDQLISGLEEEYKKHGTKTQKSQRFQKLIKDVTGSEIAEFSCRWRLVETKNGLNLKWTYPSERKGDFNIFQQKSRPSSTGFYGLELHADRVDGGPVLVNMTTEASGYDAESRKKISIEIEKAREYVKSAEDIIRALPLDFGKGSAEIWLKKDADYRQLWVRSTLFQYDFTETQLKNEGSKCDVKLISENVSKACDLAMDGLMAYIHENPLKTRVF